MAVFTYAGITLSEPLLTHEHRREILMDGPTYIGTKYNIHVRGYYSPKSTSINNGGVAQEGQLPVVTDNAIRFKLMQPRETLTYTVGGQTLIQSPAAGKATDANNGPTPTVHSIKQEWGSHTFLVDMSVECIINESNLFGGTNSVMVSNRWKMSSSLDEDFFETRRVTGAAIFRTDRLLSLGATVDDYRAWLFPPIPNQFKRHIDYVYPSEDGTTLFYGFSDNEVAVNIIAPGVTRMEVMHTRTVSNPGAERVAKAFTDATEDTIEGLTGTGKSGILSGFGQAIKGRNFREAAYRNAPTMQVSITVRVWGYRNVQRAQLQQVGVNYINARMVKAVQVLGATNYSVTQDEMGRYVEVSLSADFGPAASLGFGLGALILGADVLQFPQPEDVPGITQGAPAKNPAPPLDQNSRGLYPAKVIAAALMDSTATPPKPDTPPNFTNRTPP